MGADGGVLDHGHVIGPGHLGHAAVGVASQQIAAQQFELLQSRLGLDQVALEVVVTVQDLPLRTRQHVVGGGRASRLAGAAGLASGTVGDVLRATEADLSQAVIDRRAVGQGQVGEHLPFLAAGQVRARRGRRQKEPKLSRRKMLRHL